MSLTSDTVQMSTPEISSQSLSDLLTEIPTSITSTTAQASSLSTVPASITSSEVYTVVSTESLTSFRVFKHNGEHNAIQYRVGLSADFNAFKCDSKPIFIVYHRNTFRCKLRSFNAAEFINVDCASINNATVFNNERHVICHNTD
ncbi:hypothetical protein DPMN_074756 [Dreissena polymorpha]|nr:hypothetical protein DPMN_074756 [Dreissena polymorpha]